MKYVKNFHLIFDFICIMMYPYDSGTVGKRNNLENAFSVFPLDVTAALCMLKWFQRADSI